MRSGCLTAQGESATLCRTRNLAPAFYLLPINGLNLRVSPVDVHVFTSLPADERTRTDSVPRTVSYSPIVIALTVVWTVVCVELVLSGALGG